MLSWAQKHIFAGTIHAHPTMTEMTHEAVLATLGHAIHIA